MVRAKSTFPAVAEFIHSCSARVQRTRPVKLLPSICLPSLGNFNKPDLLVICVLAHKSVDRFSLILHTLQYQQHALLCDPRGPVQ